MLPVQTAQGSLYLRRGTMEIPTTQGLLYVVPRALILDPGEPFFLADRVLPPTGILVGSAISRSRTSVGRRNDVRLDGGENLDPAPGRAGRACALMLFRIWQKPHRHKSSY